MTITIDLTAELETRLLQEAAKQGLDPGQYIAYAMLTRLRDDSTVVPQLSEEESRLLEEINLGLSSNSWDRYYLLIARRQAGTLTEDEYSELTATSSHIEELNARRLELLAQLANLRSVTLPALIEQLGIEPRPVL